MTVGFEFSHRELEQLQKKLLSLAGGRQMAQIYGSGLLAAARVVVRPLKKAGGIHNRENQNFWKVRAVPRKWRFDTANGKRTWKRSAAAINIDAPNAHWFEYGTARRVTKSGANRGRIVPQPFIAPTFAKYGDRMLNRGARKIGQRLSRIESKQGR